ncbi:nuclear transport factor 2 family protein [Spartinivicinus ruber]|uniref:nuclear transport factor 2 family protein n=1 Tax=Spartinivicinus ruber TaxID=2683272 RepID=UPI0013D5E0FD|nr:nuclear transport factor 2 family protein [Spartinivicinus ruber]
MNKIILTFLYVIGVFTMTANAESSLQQQPLFNCKANLKTCLEEMYTTVFSNPQQIDNFFAEDYTQYADGEVLNLTEFKKHVQIVKNKVKNIHFEVTEAAKSEDTFSDRHLVTLELHDGAKAVIELIQISKLKNGKICELRELSRVIYGNKALKALASQKHND